MEARPVNHYADAYNHWDLFEIVITNGEPGEPVEPGEPGEPGESWK